MGPDITMSVSFYTVTIDYRTSTNFTIFGQLTVAIYIKVKTSRCLPAISANTEIFNSRSMTNNSCFSIVVSSILFILNFR